MSRAHLCDHCSSYCRNWHVAGNDLVCTPCYEKHIHEGVYGTGDFDGAIDQLCSRLNHILPVDFTFQELRSAA